jgi:hypothetical protein
VVDLDGSKLVNGSLFLGLINAREQTNKVAKKTQKSEAAKESESRNRGQALGTIPHPLTCEAR